jgi:hypothetical protein
MVLKMSYPLSHTVDKQMGGKEKLLTNKWGEKKKKNNRNNLSRSVANGKQNKHQTPYHTVVNFIQIYDVSERYLRKNTSREMKNFPSRMAREI